MAITLTGNSLVTTKYVFVETSGGKIVSDSETVLNSCDYTYSSGLVANFKVDAGVSTSGVLPSGGTVVVNFQSVSKTQFGITTTVGFSGVKNLLISNTATVSGYDIAVRATGTGALTDLFNGGSGNLLIKPYSTYVYNDPYRGLRTSGTQNRIQLFDVSGSGAPYSISILGNLT